MTEKQLDKLPKWAQDHIKDLTRALETAKDALTRFCDNQTQSLVWYDEIVSDNAEGPPSFRRNYIQARTVSFGDECRFGKVIRVSYDLDDSNLFHINGDDGIVIAPRASNDIEIRTGQ